MRDATLTCESRTEASADVAVRIGEIDVAVRGGGSQVRREFERLYAGYPRAGPGGSAIRMDVRQEPRRWARRASYSILGDGEPIGPPQPRESVLPCVEWGINFRVAARRTDFLQIHAASVSFGGAGVILAADSGSGKSTLALGLLTRQWQYLSDEFALVSPRTLQLHPFPKAICLKQGSFDAARRLGVSLDAERYWIKFFKGQVTYVNPLRFGPRALGEPCPVRWILFPRYEPGAQPGLRAVSRAEAAYELARHSMNRTAFGPAVLPLYAALVRSANCYILRTGDLGETCDFLTRLVTRARPADGPATRDVG